MSRKFMLLALLLAVGCAKEAPPAAPGPQAAATAATDAVETAACPEPRYSPLPPGAVFDQDFLVRRDRVNQTRSGALRRRTSLELLGGDAASLAAAIADRYAAEGFRRLDVADRGDGIVRFAVAKGGVGRINIAAAAGRPDKPVHPASVGVVSFDWPVAGAGVATGADEASPESEGAAQPGA